MIVFEATEIGYHIRCSKKVRCNCILDNCSILVANDSIDLTCLREQLLGLKESSIATSDFGSLDSM